jgi:hypothetical protein
MLHKVWSRIIATTITVVAVVIAVPTPVLAGTLALSASVNPVGIGEVLTVTFTPKIMTDSDHVTFNFGDGSSTTEVSFVPLCGIFGGCGTVTHTYARLGTFNITASGTIGGESVDGELGVLVTTGSDRFVLAVAHATGINQTNWRSDVELHNPERSTARLEISLLERQKDNSNPLKVQVTVPPDTAVRLEDVLASRFSYNGTAALRISPESGTFIATSRTYNALESGTYGQYVPVVPFEDAVPSGKAARLIQLSHNPTLASGYRTNIGLVNPAPIDIQVEIKFFDSDGVSLGKTDVDLLPYEFRQIDKAFELVTNDVVDDGYVVIRAITPNTVFFAYASVVDNLTGDPTLIPSLIPTVSQ